MAESVKLRRPSLFGIWPRSSNPSPSHHLPSHQMEQVKQDLSRKDSELLGLQTKLETLMNQFSDSKQHIEVLKESLTAKEQRAAILQTEVKEVRAHTLSP